MSVPTAALALGADSPAIDPSARTGVADTLPATTKTDAAPMTRMRHRLGCGEPMVERVMAVVLTSVLA